MYATVAAGGGGLGSLGYTEPTADQIGFHETHRAAYTIQSSFRSYTLQKRVAAEMLQPRSLDRNLGIIRKRKTKSVQQGGVDMSAEPTGVLTSRQKLWLLVSDPTSSVAAYALAVGILLFIVVSCTAFVVETIPDFGGTAFYGKHPDSFSAMEVVCVIVFTMEFAARLCSAPSLSQFAKDILNWVDLVSILPFYIERLLELFNVESSARELAIIRLVRLARVFRLLKLGRHSTGLKIFAGTLQKSVRPMITLCMFVACGVVIIASIMYYVERGHFVCSCSHIDAHGDAGSVGSHCGEMVADSIPCVDDHENGYWVGNVTSDCGASKCSNPRSGRHCCIKSQFQDIPSTCYFALVTMTTVGYGDVRPSTMLGKICASCFCVFGVVLIALPISVISANFKKIFFEFETASVEAQGDTDNSDGHVDQDDPSTKPTMRRMHDVCNADLDELIHLYMHEEEMAYARCRNNTMISLSGWLPEGFKRQLPRLTSDGRVLEVASS